MKVFVYYNLHKKLWSIKALEGSSRGRVVAHRTHVFLVNAYGKVSQAGRGRVLKEKRKNVHAGIVGEWMPEGWQASWDFDESLWTEVTYNPYLYSTFVYKEDEKPFDTVVARCILAHKKVKVTKEN
jgi:hypothetical protein